MLRRIAFQLACLMVLTGSCLTLAAQQFSAILVHQKPKEAVPSKVFVRGDKIRFETGDKQRAGIVVVDLKQQTGFMALTLNQSYIVFPPGRAPFAMPFFHPADPENACPAWDKLAGKTGSCSRVGDDTVHGRAAVKYKGIAKNGDAGFAWVDRKLNFVIKWEGQAGAAEFQNIREAPQAQSLFDLPKGYNKADSRAEHATGVNAGKAAPARRKP